MIKVMKLVFPVYKENTYKKGKTTIDKKETKIQVTEIKSFQFQISR